MVGMSRTARACVCLAMLIAPTSALAADVVLLPHAQAAPGVDESIASNVEALVSEVMQDNEFVVLDPEVVRRVLGPVLDSCTSDKAASCASVALTGTPARLAVLLTVLDEEGRTMLQVDFVGPDDPEPMRQMVLPMEEGKERRLALQITMFAIDTAEDLGPAPPALVESARHLVATEPEVVTRIEGPKVEDLLAEEPEEVEPLVFDEPEPTDPEGPELEVPDEIFEEEERGEVGSLEWQDEDGQIPRRFYLGSERSYKEHRGRGDGWLKKKRPHAGRVLFEVRGGVGLGDLTRSTTVLGEPSSVEGQLASTFFQEAPQFGVVGRVEGYVGYAPVTMIDVGLLVGVNIASDDVTVGYMGTDEEPDLGSTEQLTVPRVYLQPRLRAYLVPLGIAKPYLLVGGEILFVPDWAFDITTNEPFPRPAGGITGGAVGGGGLSIDPDPRMGLLLEVTGTRYFGGLSGPRFEGELIGTAPPGLDGVRRWAVGISLGLQFRL